MSFKVVNKFEKKIAKFFGAPYAVAVDSCTHGLELCIRYQQIGVISVPNRTYISVPFLANKLKIQLEWRDEIWKDYYMINNKKQITIDTVSKLTGLTTKQIFRAILHESNLHSRRR